MWKEIDKTKGPIYRQMMDQIMKNIENGNLAPGERLPSERKLAAAFRTNRTTVVRALDELRDLGVLTSRQGSGRYVNQTEWGKFSVPRINWRELFSQRYEQVDDWYEERIKEAKKQPDFLDLFSSEMPNKLLPDVQFPAHTMAEMITEEQKMTDLGYLPLVEKIEGYLSDEFQFDFSRTQLLVTVGGQQAIFLILQTLLSNGDAVAVESPSFFYRLALFRATGTRLFGIPMDDEGIDLAILEKSIQKNKIKAVLVNPNFQNPTGKVMSQKRRNDLVVLCRKYQVPIVEDDVFSDLSFREVEKSPVSIHSLDPENVLYVGSLSRLLGKTTKIGWIIGPQTLIFKLAKAQQMMEFSMSIFTQIAATAVFEESYDAKLALVRNQLQEKSLLLQKWAQKQNFFNVWPIKGGYYAWVTWEGKKMTAEIASEAVAKGLGVAPSWLFGRETNGIRINFSRLDQDRMIVFAKRMEELAGWLQA
ncbi:PLP-dependent aminotransferase family protein [Enterococcus durans]|uniref:aminotransferase-like domain-containing protein n=1 Tax=Enterococcus durans TaxID=53345 RepID=UPI0039A58D6E